MCATTFHKRCHNLTYTNIPHTTMLLFATSFHNTSPNLVAMPTHQTPISWGRGERGFNWWRLTPLAQSVWTVNAQDAHGGQELNVGLGETSLFCSGHWFCLGRTREIDAHVSKVAFGYYTASLSHLRKMLPGSASSPLPAKRPYHAT